MMHSFNGMAMPVASPYEQKFVDQLHFDFEYSKKIEGQTHKWGRVPFEARLRVDSVKGEDPRLHMIVSCNKGSSDPHWRCSYTVTIQYTIQDVPHTLVRSADSSREKPADLFDILRLPDNMNEFGKPTFHVTIKIDSWAGICPEPLQSFMEPTDLTDATLVVEGKRLYASRTILALQSKVFYRMFYDKKFKDWQKSEYTLPPHISFADMLLFLYLIYPNTSDEERTPICSIDTIEAMLKVADYFECSSVTRLMEKMLMDDTRKREIVGLSQARILLVADRYRLSALYSKIYNVLRSDKWDRKEKFYDELIEYPNLSDDLRSTVDRLRFRAFASAPSTSRSSTETGPSSANGTAAPPIVSPIKSSAVAAAAGRNSWSNFQADIFSVLLEAPNFKLASAQQTTDLQQALQFVQQLTRRQYEVEVSSILRRLLHEIDIAAARQEAQEELVLAVGAFIGRVDLLRSVRASAMTAAPDDAAGPSTSTAAAHDGLEWSQFVAGVGTLRENTFREIMSPADLKKALDFLLNLDQAAFVEIPSQNILAIHGIIVALARMMNGVHPQYGYVRDLLNELVSMVNALRNNASSDDSPSPSKRMRTN